MIVFGRMAMFCGREMWFEDKVLAFADVIRYNRTTAGVTMMDGRMEEEDEQCLCKWPPTIWAPSDYRGSGT